jgi:hypothetical protein
LLGWSEGAAAPFAGFSAMERRVQTL